MRWLDGMLQLIGMRAAFDLFAAPCSNLLLACGVAKYFAVGNTARAAMVSVGMWLVNVRFGIHGIIILLLFVPIVGHLFNIQGVYVAFRKVLKVELIAYAAFLCLVILTLIATQIKL